VPSPELYSRMRESPLLRALMIGIVGISAVLIAVSTALTIDLARKARNHETRLSDIEVWTATQLEVDYLKLFNNLHEAHAFAHAAGRLDPGMWSEVVRHVDLYFSRTTTVLTQFRRLDDGSGVLAPYRARIEGILRNRQALVGFVDGVADPSPADLEILEAKLLAVAEEVRLIAIDVLGILTERASAERAAFQQDFRRGLVFTSSTGIGLVLIALLSLSIYRQAHARAAAFQQLGASLEQIIDAGPNPVIVTDEAGQILRQNSMARHAFGWGVGAARGRSVFDLLLPPARLRVWRQRGGPDSDIFALGGGLSRSFREIVRDAKGRRLPVSATVVRVLAPQSGPRFVLSLTDISENQQAMRVLRGDRRRAESEAARHWRYLTVMSHDIRTPLHGVIAALDLLRERALDPASAGFVAIAAGSARTALAQADEVLDAARLEHEVLREEPAPFSPAETLHELVAQVASLAARGENRVVLEIDGECEGQVMGQRPAFWHAASNLLGNALKFTRRGSVTLRLAQAETAGHMRLEVVDTGMGISAEDQKIILRDHVSIGTAATSGPKGAGLGLGVVVRAVEQMQGTFGFDSVLGKGSRFWFEFPAFRSGTSACTESPATEPVPLAPRRILVVDDSRINRTLLVHMLEILGLTADVAADGAAAVAKAGAEPYDLILMDIGMPGMDGLTATARIRASGGPSQRAAIFAFTANAFLEAEIDPAGRGLDGVLVKPVTLAALRQCLARLDSGQSCPLPAPVPEPQADLIDRLAVGDLAAAMGPGAVASLVLDLLDEAEALAARLAETPPPADLAARMHRIAGAAAMLGATALHDRAAEAETALGLPGRLPGPDFAPAWLCVVETTRSEFALVLDAATDGAGDRRRA